MIANFEAVVTLDIGGINVLCSQGTHQSEVGM